MEMTEREKILVEALQRLIAATCQSSWPILDQARAHARSVLERIKTI